MRNKEDRLKRKNVGVTMLIVPVRIADLFLLVYIAGEGIPQSVPAITATHLARMLLEARDCVIITNHATCARSMHHISGKSVKRRVVFVRFTMCSNIDMEPQWRGCLSPGGGDLRQFLLGMCRWPLRAPTPL